MLSFAIFPIGLFARRNDPTYHVFVDSSEDNPGSLQNLVGLTRIQLHPDGTADVSMGVLNSKQKLLFALSILYFHILDVVPTNIYQCKENGKKLTYYDVLYVCQSEVKWAECSLIIGTGC